MAATTPNAARTYAGGWRAVLGCQKLCDQLALAVRQGKRSQRVVWHGTGRFPGAVNRRCLEAQTAHPDSTTATITSGSAQADNISDATDRPHPIERHGASTWFVKMLLEEMVMALLALLLKVRVT